MTGAIKNLVFVMVWLLPVASANQLSAWHFFIKDTVFMESPEITLGDLGSVYGSELSREERERLIQTKIAFYPSRSCRVSQTEIQKLLKTAFLEPETVRGEYARFEIREKQVDVAEIEAAIMEGQRFIPRQGDFRVVVEKPVSIPSFLNYRIETSGASRPGEKKGWIKPDITGYDSYEFTYTVMRKAIVYTAARLINPGERILKGVYSSQEIYTLEDESPGGQVDPLGYISRASIPEGSVIYPYQIKKITDVRPGDQVQLTYRTGNILIMVNAHAMQSGSIGQTIKLRTRNNRIVFGEIQGKQAALYIQNGDIR